MNKNLLWLIALVLVPLTAQEELSESNDEDFSLIIQGEELVFTASRQQELVDYSTAGIILLDKEELAKFSSVTQALKSLPSINLSGGTSPEATVTMGGFGENGFTRVLVLVNGVPQNQPDMASINWAALPIQGISRIEVVQGPMSARYGDQALAGVIQIFTEDAPGLVGSVSLSGLSDLSYGITENLAYNSDDWGFFLDAAKKNMTPSRDNTQSEQLSFSLGADLYPKWGEHGISADYFSSDYGMAGGLTQQEYESNPDNSNNPDDKISQWGITLSSKNILESDRIVLNIPLAYDYQEKAIDWVSMFSYSDSQLTSLSIPLNIQRDLLLGDNWEGTLQAGVDFRYASMAVQRYSSADRDSPTIEAEISRTNGAPWVRAKLISRNQMVFELGGRYEFSRLDAYAADTALDDSLDQNALVFDFGWVYIPSEEVKFRLHYGSLFRLPTLDEQASYYGYGSDVVYTDIDPEKGHGISISGSYSQEDFALSITPFLTWMDQEIVYDSSQFRNVNMGESLRTGCTFSGKYSHQWLSLSAGYNYTRGVILYGENEANEIPLVSPHVVTGKVSIQLPMGLDIYSQYRFNSPYYQGGDEANDQDLIPGRHDVNLGLSYSILDNFIFRIYGNNLLNDRTPTKVYYNSFSGESAWYPLGERSFGLELTYQF